MCDLCGLIFGLVVDLFRSRAALEAEVLVLKQQIIVLRRGKPNRMSFLAVDRFILGWVCRLFPKAHDALAIVRPDTVVRWHRAGFRLFWRWPKSRLGTARHSNLFREIFSDYPSPYVYARIVVCWLDARKARQVASERAFFHAFRAVSDVPA